MKKRVFYSEAAYIAGMLLIAVGVVFMEKSDFGVSMIVAPAYILFRWLSPTFSFFTFGMAEYCLQAVLLLAMSLILRKFKLCYLLSFATAVIYGFILDLLMALGVYLPIDYMWQRVIYYIIGVLTGSAGVAMMFRTYISPEAYELFVKEVSSHIHVNIHKFKTVYDLSSCLLGVVMSFIAFGFGEFVGVKWGTILCALVNGYVISLFSRMYDSRFVFSDRLPYRKFFAGM